MPTRCFQQNIGKKHSPEQLCTRPDQEYISDQADKATCVLAQVLYTYLFCGVRQGELCSICLSIVLNIFIYIERDVHTSHITHTVFINVYMRELCF